MEKGNQKGHGSQMEDTPAARNNCSPLSEGSEMVEKDVIRKIDLHILPILVVVYIVAFIDRYVLRRHNPLTILTNLKLP
jgi:hypothetical protein